MARYVNVHVIIVSSPPPITPVGHSKFNMAENAESVGSNCADPNIGYEHQWWKNLDLYHRQKVQYYLGKSVNCSKPVSNEEWWRCLDINDRDPTREIAEGARNLQVNPRASAGSQSEETKSECRTEFDGSAGITPYKDVKVNGGFHIKRVIKTSSKKSMEYKDKETITFSQDIGGEDVLNPCGHTKFEVELCKCLLSKINSTLTDEIKAIELEVQNATDEIATVKGKLQSLKVKLDDVMKVQDSNTSDSVTRFEAFVNNDEEMMWKMVADACYSYFAEDDFCFTHYVHCITLGTMVQKSEISENTNKTTSANAGMKGSEFVDTGVKATKEMDHKRETSATMTRGTEDKVEVTDVTTRPVSNLISNKSRELSRLKLVVAELIKRHNIVNEGMQAVHNQTLHSMIDHTMNWLVIPACMCKG